MLGSHFANSAGRGRKNPLKQHLIIPSSGEAFIRDCGNENALAKLSRYETSLERSFYKALHELQRLQAARHGRDVPLPMAMDVEVSHTGPRVIEGTVEEVIVPEVQVAQHSKDIRLPPAIDIEPSDASTNVVEGAVEEDKAIVPKTPNCLTQHR